VGVKVTITPGPRNSYYAHLLRERASAAALRRTHVAALRKAAKPMSDGVQTDLGHYMPHRGGYLATLGGSLRARITPLRNAVEIRDAAKGKSHGRDLRSLERGRLRHPTFGRRQGRRGQGLMYNTSIPARFFTEPITARADQAVAAIVKAMRELAVILTS
jgi:hypothetical protein